MLCSQVAHFLHCVSGLTNGAQGKVISVHYKEGEGPPKLPAFVVVAFDSYTGPSFFEEIPRSVPIVPIVRTWVDHGRDYARMAVPIMPSDAISIHKSQVK